MSDSTLSLSPLGETTSHSTRLQETAAKSLVIPSRERPQSPIFFAQIENAVAMFAIASACRAEAPLRGVPPLFKMPLRPAKIIRRNRKRSALRPASKDNGRSSKPAARLKIMGRGVSRDHHAVFTSRPMSRDVFLLPSPSREEWLRNEDQNQESR